MAGNVCCITGAVLILIISLHRNIELVTPYSVSEQPRELHYTYLDTIGRPVVTATSTNMVEVHIQDFQLTYTFDKVMLLQEPLLIVVALYLFFLLVVVIARLDFSITKVTLLVCEAGSLYDTA